MPRVRPTGVRITLQGQDQVAVEAAADELKHRFGIRFAVTGRRRSVDLKERDKEGLKVWGTLLVDVATDMDASVMDLLDRLYAGQATDSSVSVANGDPRPVREARWDGRSE